MNGPSQLQLLPNTWGTWAVATSQHETSTFQLDHLLPHTVLCNPSTILYLYAGNTEAPNPPPQSDYITIYLGELN